MSDADPHWRWSRRRFLVAAGMTLVAASCGKDSSSNGKQTSSDTPASDFNALVNRFADGTLAPGRRRVPVVLATADGVSETGPPTLTGRISAEDGTVVVDQIVAERHDQGVPSAYWPFLLEVTKPGVYQLAVRLGGKDLTTAFTVSEPSSIAMPKVGDRLPPVDTPTVGDHRGVEPICTRQPACPLHDRTLTEALATGLPVAYIIGTPAYCQTASCAPALEFLLAEHDRLGPAVPMVHAEVYTDSTVTTTAPAVDSYSLTFEPVLFVTDAQGLIAERLDSIWDAAELRTALERGVA